MALEPGNVVNLLVKGSVIGVGRVLRTTPDAYCNGVRLGDQKVSIAVMSWTTCVSIPFPFDDVETIDNAVNHAILWKRKNLSICDDVPDHPNQYGPDVTSPVHINSPVENTGSSVLNVVDLLDRRTWLLKDCTPMHHSIQGKELARARVTCIESFQCVQGAALGEFRVGVLVLDLLCLDDEASMNEHFPTYAPASPLVCAWDVTDIHFPNVGVPVNEAENGDANDVVFSSLGDTVPGVKVKRHYNFNKRKFCTPEEKQHKLNAMKRSKVMRENEVFNGWHKECCKDLCCRQVVFESIVRERDEYWSQPPGDRCTTILDKLHSREESVKLAGKMIFDSKIVCKKAFYTLYGFGRTLFFEYLKRADCGMSAGFHWGNGREKPTKNVSQALVYMRDVMENSSEPQPHLTYKGTSGTDRRIHKIPICLGKDGIFSEVNRLLELNGYGSVSSSTFYSAWRKRFANFQIYSTCAFAKCNICLCLKEKLMKEKREQERKVIAEERQLHLDEAMSRRILYYGHRELAISQPEKYLSLIHDKMDQGKTAVPRLLETSKKLSQGCSALPFALTGMLTHGREPGAFGHFSLNGLWPGDPNFTITSLAKCLRDLKCWDEDHSDDLSITSTDGINEPFFKALLNPAPFKTGYLDPKGISPDHFRERGNVAPRMASVEEQASPSFRSLPKNLLLQLDNSPKDNKNLFLLAWLSHLVGRGHFETVQVSFLMVGHTHEDVDALFSKVSSQLHTHEVETLHGLMAEFWSCQKSHPVPSFIQEVADYKSFCKGHLKNMEGQSFPMSFRFFMRNNQPMMQYRESVNGSWYPLTGKSIWKVNPLTKKPELPSGQPFAKPMKTQLRKLKEVKAFIEKYLSWKNLTAPDAGSPLSGHFPELRKYWESILEFLNRDFVTKVDLPREQGNDDSNPGHHNLQQPFWPRTNHGTGIQDEYVVPVVPVDPLEAEHAEHLREIDEIFVGNLSERLPETFAPLAHIQAGDMCIIRPHDEFEQQVPNAVWLARALSGVDVDKSSRYYHQFRIEWWRPAVNSRQRDIPDSARYKNWSAPSRDWERDPGYAVLEESSDADTYEYLHASSTIYSWKPAGIFPRKNVRISRTALCVIKDHFERLCSEEGNSLSGANEAE